MAAKNGLFCGGVIPYGYKFAKDKGNTLQINEETALVGKRIFKMKLDGFSCIQIAKALNDEGIPTPTAYEKNSVKYSKNKYYWYADTIWYILKNETYIGKLISHKKETYRTSEGMKIRKAIPIIVENVHEPIIDKETFYAVNSRKKAPKKIHTGNKNLFSGKIKCGECERRYTYSVSKHMKYYCKTPTILTTAKCYRKKIEEGYLVEYVLRELEKKINNVGLSEKLEKKANNSENKNYSKIKMSLKK